MIIYKVFREPEWAELVQNGETDGAPIDLADGYIHFSKAQQLRETVEKHFAGSPTLVLLAVDTETLGAAIKWEVARGGSKFPHLYRKLRRSDVVSHVLLPVGENGHAFPDDIP